MSNESNALPGHLAVEQARSSAQSGQWVSALISYDQALNESDAWSMNPDFLNDRAVALFHNERMEDSIHLLSEAIALQPDYGYRYAARGWLKQATKDVDGAMEDYKKALQLDPEDAITQNNLGLLEEQMGRIHEAQQRFQKADLAAGIPPTRPAPKLSSTGPKVPAKPIGSSPKLRSEFIQIISTKKGWREFIAFIRNGFKLNE